ncbi:hypothetical protein Tco_1211138 [Tanacetum coccineum]
MLKRCEDTNLSLNWEKPFQWWKEGIVLNGHKFSKSGLELDRAKVKTFSKIWARPMAQLLEKEPSIFFSKSVSIPLNTLKRKLTEAIRSLCSQLGPCPLN